MDRPKWDNYALAAEQARKLFLDYDQERMIAKLGLPADSGYLYIRFLDLDYRIHRKTGMVEKREGTGPYVDGNSFNEVMTLFDVLCWSKEGARLSGQWVTLSCLGGGVHGGSLAGSMYREEVAEIARWEDRLAEVLERMGGVRMPKGEPGYVIPVFSFLPVYVQYWRGDEEFPPQLNLLWDANTTEFLHYETVYYLMNFLLQRLVTLLQRVSGDQTK